MITKMQRQISSNNYPFVILMIFLLCLNAINCTKMAEKEIHYIPKGFIGRVYIFFDIPHGSATYSGKERVYNISSSGQSFSSLKANDGFLKDGDRSFYCGDENAKDKITFLPEIDDENLKRRSNEVCVFNLIVGQSHGISYLSYCVDTLKKSTRYYDPDLSSLNKIIDSIVRQK